MASSSQWITFLIFIWVFSWITQSGYYSSLSPAQESHLKTFYNHTHQEVQSVRNCSLDSDLKALNLTNIHSNKSPSKLNPFLPQAIESKIEKLWKTTNNNLFFTNLSSVLHGEYHRGDLESIPMQIPSVYDETVSNYSFNSLESGKISITISESVSLNDSRALKARLQFADFDEFFLEGVYFSKGHLVMSTDSLKFSGNLALPWLVPYGDNDNSIRELILTQKEKVLEQNLFEVYQYKLDEAMKCEWVLYGHVHPESLSESDLEDIENELQHPEGRPIPRVPPVNLEAVLYSPDCGAQVVLQTNGERMEHYMLRLRRMIATLLLIYLGIATLTILQVQYTDLPSATARVSFWTITITSLADGIVCMICMLLLFEKELVLQLTAVVMIGICLITTLDLQYMVNIFISQLSEGSPNANMGHMQLSSMIFSRFLFAWIFLCLLTITSYGFRESWRQYYEWALLSVAYSSWWPQIFRNATKEISRPFLPSYIIGTSILRLLPLLYVCFDTDNVGYHRYDPTLAWTFVGWQLLQHAFLFAQYEFGGQFFLPSANSYDYHPVVSEDLEECLHSDLHINDTENTAVKQVDCPICMNPVDLVVENTPGTLLMRRKYMITPCKHVFHTDCLEEWMDSKPECPVCRTPLPPNSRLIFILRLIKSFFSER